MNSVAVLIGMVCVCGVAVSVLGIISPNGMTSKTLGLVTGVFIVCVMIVPLKNFFTDFSLDLTMPEIPESISGEAQNAYNDAVVAEVKSRLEKTLLSTLVSEGYSVNKTEINPGKNEDGGIYIEGISIYIDKGENRILKITRRTEEILNVTPSVITRQ